MKEEIDAKEAALTKEHFDLAQKEKEIEEAKKKIEKLSSDITSKDNNIKNFVIKITWYFWEWTNICIIGKWNQQTGIHYQRKWTTKKEVKRRIWNCCEWKRYFRYTTHT